MSDDIVPILRFYKQGPFADKDHSCVLVPINILEAAADEIERLRSVGVPFPPIDQCNHQHRVAQGTILSDGSGSQEWLCPTCGASGRSSWGPRTVPLVSDKHMHCEADRFFERLNAERRRAPMTEPEPERKP